jgi:hypothetical protein
MEILADVRKNGEVTVGENCVVEAIPDRMPICIDSIIALIMPGPVELSQPCAGIVLRYGTIQNGA